MTDPKESSDSLALRSAPKPVRRLNRRVLIVGTGVLGAGVLAVTLWSLQPKTQPLAASATAEPQAQVDRVSRAEGLESLPRDYSGVPQLGRPLGELGRPILRAEQEAGIDSMEEGGFAPDFTEDAARAQRLKDVQEDEAAAKAQVFFQLANRKRDDPGESPPAEGPSALERALALVPGQGSGTAGSARPDGDPVDSNRQSSKRPFAGVGSDETLSGSQLETPTSPYQLLAGTVISAALITGINSDLPGQITASVTENVFDTVSGRHVLIPQGSRLIGRYDSEVTFGQSRVLLVWTRLLRPDGSSITLDRLPGVDAAGNAGLTDKVDFHWRRIFAGAAVSSLIGVGAELASPSRDANGNAVMLAGRDSLQGSITDVGQQITQRNLGVQPTLTIRPGFPLRIIVNNDISIQPFRDSRGSR
jgi:type IV secretion system protein TrbI